MQKIFLAQLNTENNTIKIEEDLDCSPSLSKTGTVEDVSWLMTAHYIDDLDEIKIRHLKTFHLRQTLIKDEKSLEIPDQYPRFFDVDDLVSYFI